MKSSYGMLLVLAMGGAMLSSCSGRNLNKELSENKEVMVREWTRQTREHSPEADRGSEFSNPVFFENTLIFGNQTVGLQSIYPMSNQPRWELAIPGGVLGELTVSGTSVYFGGGDGFIYAVDAETGRVLWKYEVRNPRVSRPTVKDGRLFITTTDDSVYALDAGTGKWLWHYRRKSSPVATTRNAAQPVIDEREVLTGMSDGFLIALSLDDGQLKWERKIHQGTKFTDVDASPVLDGDRLYVPSYDGGLYCLKRKGGEVIWRFDSGGAHEVTLEGDVIYLPSSDGYVYALQKSQGKLLWKFELDRGTPTTLIPTERHLIFGSSFQYFYVVDKASGKGVYRYNVGYGSGFAGAPAYDSANRRLYVLSGGGNLMAFKLRNPRRARPRGSTDGYLETELYH